MKDSDEFDDMSLDDITGSEKLMADMLALLMEHPDKFMVNEADDDILAAEDDDSYE